MLVTSKSVLRLRDGLALYGGDSTGNKYWLFDTVTGRHFRINQVGYTALSLLDGIRSVNQVIKECADLYKIDVDAVSSDINEFLSGCLQTDLLREQQ